MKVWEMEIFPNPNNPRAGDERAGGLAPGRKDPEGKCRWASFRRAFPLRSPGSRRPAPVRPAPERPGSRRPQAGREAPDPRPLRSVRTPEVAGPSRLDRDAVEQAAALDARRRKGVVEKGLRVAPHPKREGQGEARFGRPAISGAERRAAASASADFCCPA